MHKIILFSLVSLLFTLSTGCNTFPDLDEVVAEAERAGEPPRAIYNARELQAAKNRLFEAAEYYTGQGDPDFEIQNALQPLVDEVLRINPQPPVVYRLDELSSAWTQVWGPYSYRGDDRGVDDEMSVDEIYQVVFDEGYYYNVAPMYEDGDESAEKITLLKGQFAPVDIDSDFIQVRFRSLEGLNDRPNSPELWDLPELLESGALDNVKKRLPNIFVRTFFAGGFLREVYTDDTLRIAYGNSERSFGEGEYLYIMRRVRAN